MGAVAAGELLIRSGTTIIGAAIGSVVQAYNALLLAIAGLSVNGIIVRTGSSSAQARTITAGAGVTITNGDGVSGNPVVTVSGVVTNTELDAVSYRWWQLVPEGTSVLGVGVTPFANGTGSSVAAGVAGYISLQITLTNSTSNYSIRANSTSYRTDQGGTNGATVKVHYVSPSATTNHRVWFAQLVSIGTGTTPTGQCCGLVYDPSRSANWLVFSYDGTTFATADTGVVYAVSTHYYLKIRMTTAGVYGVASTTASGLSGAETAVTTNLVTSTTSMLISLFVVRTAAGATTYGFAGMDYAAAIV
jgi:hypothetical protein